MYPSKTLSELYDPDKMPSRLLEAHQRNDLLVESLYTNQRLTSDSERLSVLFNAYQSMKRERENA